MATLANAAALHVCVDVIECDRATMVRVQCKEFIGSKLALFENQRQKLLLLLLGCCFLCRSFVLGKYSSGVFHLVKCLPRSTEFRMNTSAASRHRCN